MPIPRVFRVAVLVWVITLASGCSNNVDPATDPIGFANLKAQSHVASDVTLTFDKSTEKVFHPVGETYAVCGIVEVNQPTITDHRRERFVIPINDQMNGMATFDGSADPSLKQEFEELHGRLCS